MEYSSHKLLRAVVLGMAILAASCDSGTDVPTPVTITLALDLGVLQSAQSQIERIHLRVTYASGTQALDTTFARPAGATVIQGIEIPLQSADEVLDARVEMLSGSTVLFEGSTQLVATSGAELAGVMAVTPVVGSVELKGPLRVFTAIGDRQPLEGVALFTSGQPLPGARLQWASADPEVAAVIVGGLEARGEGTTTVTGSLGDKSAQLEVTVQAVVSTLKIEPENVRLPFGFETQIGAVARDSNGNTLSRTATWSSADPSIATVDQQGSITGVTIGFTILTAEVDGVMASSDVEITPAPPGISGMESPSPGTRTANLHALVTPNGAESTVRFEWSTDQEFSSVQTGRTHEVGAGLEPVAVVEAVRLNPSTEYFFRVLATNDFGETVSGPTSFTTSAPTGGFVDGAVFAEGEPVSGATVRLDAGPTVVTGDDGRFAFDEVGLGAHTVELEALPPGVVFEEVSQSGVLDAVGQVLVLDFEGEFLRQSTIRGQVSASGIALPDVTVTLTGPDMRQGVTDGFGRFAFKNIRSGTYEVGISDFDGEYLSFAALSRTASVDISENRTVNFDGVDTDLLDVELFAFYGIDGVNPGVAPAPGVSFAIYPTEADLSGGTRVMGAGVTSIAGKAVVRIRKRDDVGPNGTPRDNLVWAKVTGQPAGNISVQADGVVSVGFDPSATLATAADTTDLLNGSVELGLTLKTITTGMPDSPLYLHLWDMGLWEDTTQAPVATVAAQHGNVSFSVNKTVPELPVTLYVRALDSQDLAYGADWFQVPLPAAGASAAGRYLAFELDGTRPPGTTTNAGITEITYINMHFYTNVHHEIDEATPTPTRSFTGDDLEGATAVEIYFYQNGSLVDSRPIRSYGAISAILRIPSFDQGTAVATTSDPAMVFITPTTLPSGGNGGGTVGQIGPQGGYRHSVRVCGLATDTVIQHCSGFAYKFNNTRIQGRVTRAGGSAAGVPVTLKRCRPPQSLDAQGCNSPDGFELQDTTDGSGYYSFTNLLEGIYEVRSGAGPVRMVKPRGRGNSQTVDLSVP